MGGLTLSDVCVTPLRRIATPGGDVMHAMKCTDAGFSAFGEAYFSWIEPGAVKAWKRHKQMTLNLVVPVGTVRFVFILPEDRTAFRIEDIGVANYSRITVPPGVWFGFQGRDAKPSLVFNLADIAHDPDEVERISLTDISYDWQAL